MTAERVPQQRYAAVLGGRGVAAEVCALVCVEHGLAIARTAQVEAGDPAIAVLILVEPSADDWRRAARCGRPIIVVAEEERLTDEAVVEMLLEGADAVITTFDDAAAVRRALDIVLAGEVMLPRTLAKALLGRLRETWRRSPAVELTKREREILQSIIDGDAIKQTARSLGITIKTVQNIQSRLFRKLGARNRAQTVARAHELGLLRE